MGSHSNSMVRSLPFFGERDTQWLRLSQGSRRSLGMPWRDDDDDRLSPPSDLSGPSTTSSSSSSSSRSSSSSSFSTSLTPGNCLSKVLASGGVFSGALATLDDDDIYDSDGTLGDDDDDVTANDDDDALVFGLQLMRDGRLTGWAQSGAWRGDDDDGVETYEGLSYPTLITCNFQVDCEAGDEVTGSGVCTQVRQGVAEVVHPFDTSYWNAPEAEVSEFYGGYVGHSTTFLNQVPLYGHRDAQWQFVSPRERQSLGLPRAQVTENWYGVAYDKKEL